MSDLLWLAVGVVVLPLFAWAISADHRESMDREDGHPDYGDQPNRDDCA